MRISIFLLLIVIFFNGCTNPINELNAKKYYGWGEEAVAQGDLHHAKKMYSRALVNARVGNMELDLQSQIYMKLGRVNGGLCNYNKAEQYFLEILELYKNTEQKQSKYIFIATMEIGQFNYDIGRYKKAVKYFEKALVIDGNNLKKNFPTAYYEILVDYSDAFMKIGNENKAEELRVIIKSNSQFLKDPSGYERYPKECK